jgi:hypothetical protein
MVTTKPRADSYLIAWSQTAVEGLRGPALPSLETGSSWSWTGEPVGLGPPLGEEAALGDDAVRPRTIRAVRSLLGHVIPPVRPVCGSGFDEIATTRAILVSCGRASYRVTLVEIAETARPLLLFEGALPPKDRPLRIVEGLYPAPGRVAADPRASVICFTPGTRLLTPSGPLPVETLREGDLVQTRDSGAQPVLWIGRRELGGAQMHALPDLRPIRIRGGAMGTDVPDADLVVSPRHRILLKGPVADALFGTPEVLVAAEDLVNDTTVIRDHQPPGVSYIHLLLPKHHIVWANGVETESFHPASTDLRMIEAAQFVRLARIVPGVQHDPRSYGEAVRRELSRSEARVLRAEAERPH